MTTETPGYLQCTAHLSVCRISVTAVLWSWTCKKILARESLCCLLSSHPFSPDNSPPGIRLFCTITRGTEREREGWEQEGARVDVIM